MDFRTPSCLPASYKLVNVIVQTFFNDSDGFFAVALLVYIGGFIFQCLINGEEMLHFFNHMGGQLGDVMVAVVIGVIERNGDNLFILFAAVQHGDDTDGIRTYQSQGDHRLRAEQQYV